MKALTAHDWPGNVGELANVIQRAYVQGAGPVIGFQGLPRQMQHGGDHEGQELPDLREAVRSRVEQALELSGGVRSQAAQILDIDRKSLWRMMRRYNIA